MHRAFASPKPAATASAERNPDGDVVRALPLRRDDAAIIEGLRTGHAWARAALFDRYGPLVEAVLRRVLGPEHHTELADLVHDAFVQALASIDSLRDAGALGGWMKSIAAHTAYHAIRARRARRWLRFWAPDELPERGVDGVEPELLEAYRRTHALLSRLPADERIAFALRHIEGMELGRIAEACGASLATIKRRLARAEQRFARAARRDDVLRPWLEGGGRWTS